MKKNVYTLIAGTLVLAGLSSCNEWLEVYPQNNQVSDYYWSNKEEVDATLNGCYYYYREMVTTELIPLGELRAGQLVSRGSYSSLQQMRIKETDAIANWGAFYEVINVANGVLANASGVLEVDQTYDENRLNAHLAEAYFLRALTYFYLVRNWKDVPLVLTPFESDLQDYMIPQSTEAEVIAQIKADIEAALATGAAKEFYEKEWETKGRATKWAMYALMADVCLWNGDYAECETYCDYILKSNSSYAPTFLSTATNSSWFSIFNPGNSNESILELQWDEEEEQLNTLPILFSDNLSGRMYYFSARMTQNFADEVENTRSVPTNEKVRSEYGTYYCNGPISTATQSFAWKYVGSPTKTQERTEDAYDPNFILYRVAEVILMKAEALVMQGEGRWDEALALVNEIRTRANVNEVTVSPVNEGNLLEAILDERTMELAAEGKAWYDMLRMGRRDNFKYKERFIVGRLLDYNTQSTTSWFKSVLSDNNSLFLPVWDTELENNSKLVQNPFYE